MRWPSFAQERVRVVGAQALGDRVHVRLGLGQGHAGLGHAPEGAAACRPCGCRDRGARAEGTGRWRACTRRSRRVLRERRQHADHGVDAVVHLEAAARRSRRRRPARSPELVAQEEHGVGALRSRRPTGRRGPAPASPRARRRSSRTRPPSCTRRGLAAAEEREVHGVVLDDAVEGRWPCAGSPSPRAETGRGRAARRAVSGWRTTTSCSPARVGQGPEEHARSPR